MKTAISNTPIKVSDTKEVNLTISIGVTTPTEEDTIQSIIDRADALMYQAKTNGKNTVVYG